MFAHMHVASLALVCNCRPEQNDSLLQHHKWGHQVYMPSFETRLNLHQHSNLLRFNVSVSCIQVGSTNTPVLTWEKQTNKLHCQISSKMKLDWPNTKGTLPPSKIFEHSNRVNARNRSMQKLARKLFAPLDRTPSLALLWRALPTTLQHSQLGQTPAQERDAALLR